MTFEEQLKRYIRENEQMMKDLNYVKAMNLPDCYIAAGYIRNYVWDRLHEFDARERHNDIDVVYYDRENISEEKESFLEKKLIMQTNNMKWSVKNQARMHVINDNLPYKSTTDAIAHWPETVTAVGVRLISNNDIQVISPYGLEDLFNMVVRRAPLFQNKEYYIERVKSKNWLS